MLTRTFDTPLSSYKRKDDLVILAGALKISTAGTVAVLTERIKEHLKSHPELANIQRFMGLFQDARRRVNPPGPPLASTVITHQRGGTPHAPLSSLQPLPASLPGPPASWASFPPNVPITPYAYRYTFPPGQLTEQLTAPTRSPHSESYYMSSASFNEAYTLPPHAGTSSESH